MRLLAKRDTIISAMRRTQWALAPNQDMGVPSTVFTSQHIGETVKQVAMAGKP